ncbi:MAG TPA: nuclear transport factor 2 family protein [Myxococcaceae bacterium]|nr:nuclear transport factor 2 family protein [Myxococcaceae bacterium]
MNLRRLPVLWLLAALAGCATTKIPGTEIEETSDSRAIIDVMTKYNAALDAQDAAGILALVDTSFYDDAGTLTPEDDLDYAGLKNKLPQMLQKLQDVRARITVKTMRIDGDRAAVVYTYAVTYRIGQKTQTDTDIKQMELKRVNGVWKIVKGL